MSGEILPMHPIEESLNLAAERCGDLTPFVYARLFREYPDMKPLFVRDTDSSVKGEMLAQVFEIILDFVGENRSAAQMIQCEVVTHAGYDVPQHVFGIFFTIVADTIREQLGPQWTDTFETTWQKLLRDLDYFVAHSDQHETAARTA